MGQGDKTLNMKSTFVFIFICGLMLGCNPVPIGTATLEPTLTNTLIVQSPTAEPTQTLVPLLATEIPELPSSTPSPIPATATAVPACVDIYYGENAHFEIISPSGQRVLVDINNPEKLSTPADEGDLLLTTHTHWDHFNEGFQANFPGEQLFVQTGQLNALGVIIQGIASSHNAGERLLPDGGTNYIYLIETGGLRIAHFGDIGQTTLSEEQLNILGEIDIAITQLNNPYSDMNAENRKGINLMEQLQPRLIIPTHSNLDTIKLAVLQWGGYYAESTSVLVCESDLGQDGTKILLLGETIETIKKYIDLDAWEDQ